jgi:4,4'-diaponeurosporenoate glycosyltransferase
VAHLETLAPLLDVVVVLLLGAGLFCRVQPCASEGALCRVAVIVPAHDEARSLPGLLRSLSSQQGVELEVIVVDDRSTDRTATVARDLGARVWPVTERCGNNPKAAALASLPTPDVEVLVFVDADVVLESAWAVAWLAARVIAEPRNLVSVQPYHRMERVAERLALWPNLVAILASGAFLPGRAHQSRATFGPVLAIARRRYREIGGHAAVVSAVLDDEALGRRVRGDGGKVRLYQGRGLARFRMYPEGVGSLFEGFRKNVATGALWVRGVGALGAVLVVACSCAALADVAADPLRASRWAVLAVVLCANWLVARRLGNFGPGSAVGQVVGLAFFVVVVACSVYDLARGVTSWKGQEMRTR